MYVSSVTYSLGNDDPDERTDYAKFTVLNAIMQGRDISKSITQSYLHGQGLKLRLAYSYARDHYYFGLPRSNALYVNSPDKTAITAILKNKNPGREILLNNVSVTLADFTYWAERWLADTYGYDRISAKFLRPPAGVSPTATVTYDWDPNGWINILCANPGIGGALTALKFKPNDLASQRVYAHVVYQAITNFPTEKSVTTRAALPGETDTISNVTVITEDTMETKEVITVTDTNIAAGVATVTRTVTMRVLSRPKYWLYELGAGDYPVIDGWLTESGMTGGADSPYFPSIPLRVHNHDTTDEWPWVTKTSRKLLKRVGVDYDQIVDQLNDNDQISEIDFAYLVFGVALNSKTPECKMYIFKFLEYLRSLTVYTQAEFDAWKTRYNFIQLEMAATGTGGEDGDSGGGGMPPSGSGDNPNIGYESPPRNSLHVWNPEVQESVQLDYVLTWNWINTSIKTGKIQGQPNAKPGDCAVFAFGTNWSAMYSQDMIADGSSIKAQRQIDADTYEEIEINGFVHNNYVYQGKWVLVTAWDAFNEADEEGFILPLNIEMLREMSLPKVTQLSYDCMHMVLNCYKIVKKKWYQSTWFAVLLIIVAIVLLVVTWGASAPASDSMIGAAIAILGGGLLAMIIVATVTVLVGMVLMKILAPVFIDMFGPTWGPVILAIVMMFTMNWASTGSLFGSGAMLQINAATLIQGSIAALNTYGQIMQAKTQQLDVPGQLEKLKSEYEARMEEIKKLTKENLGTNTDIIDIEGYLKASAVAMEGPDSFFRRTMMTGDDIAAITRGLVENFTEVGLALPGTS